MTWSYGSDGRRLRRRLCRVGPGKSRVPGDLLGPTRRAPSRSDLAAADRAAASAAARVSTPKTHCQIESKNAFKFRVNFKLPALKFASWASYSLRLAGPTRARRPWRPKNRIADFKCRDLKTDLPHMVLIVPPAAGAAVRCRRRVRRSRYREAALAGGCTEPGKHSRTGPPRCT
jgi:hypothetical protein